MPGSYLAAHVVLFALLGGATLGLARKERRWGIVAAALALAVGLPLQVVALKFPRAALGLIPWTDLFFFHKFTVHIAAVITAAALSVPEKKSARIRAGVLAGVLVCVACWASRDVFLPPAPLHESTRNLANVASVDSGGAPRPHVLRQSQVSSCAPAAAATLLRSLEIDSQASEAELARLCFTDPLEGTSDMGLYRGLRLSAPGRQVSFHTRSLEELGGRDEPCIVFVSLERERVPDPQLYAFLRDECNWSEGESHAVVWFGFGRDTDPRSGHSWEVAVIGDPSYGMERWAREHFAALWNGTTLEVE